MAVEIGNAPDKQIQPSADELEEDVRLVLRKIIKFLVWIMLLPNSNSKFRKSSVKVFAGMEGCLR